MRVKALLLPALMLLALARLSGGEGPAVDDRAPWHPPWESDVTNALERLPDDCAGPEAAAQAAGEAFAVAQARARRDADPRPTGFTAWWRLPLALPAAAGAWPVALEIDEARVIAAAWADGAALPAPDGTFLSSRLIDGERSLLLPLSPDHPQTVLVLRTTALASIYPDGFGQLRLRPAQLGELVRVEQRDGGRRLVIANHGWKPLSATVRIRHEDFYGAALGGDDPAVELPAGGEAALDVVLPASRELYKTRVWVEAEGRATGDHWQIHDGNRQIRQRPEVQALAEGWEYAPAAVEPAGFAPPAAGWQAVRLPHVAEGAAYTSRWAWYRAAITVPADWPVGQRLQLHVPRALYRVRVFADGVLAGERSNWELPDAVTLPAGLRPGQRVQLHLAMWDHAVGVVPGTKLPAPPSTDIPGASRMAPIERAGLGLDSVPELLGVPPLRSASCVITTPCAGPSGTHLGVAVELANDTGAAATVTVAARVLRRGVEVLRLPPRTVAVPPGGGACDLAAEWPDAVRWSLEDPVLHELRVELRRDGAVVDTTRERFGVRSFAIAGDRFALNGTPVVLLGGSHVVLSTLLWPLRLHPYRILRHNPNAPQNGFGSGPETINLADELGVLVKGESCNFGALHQSRHDWTRPELYDRSFSEMRAMRRRYANSPSLVFWDVGNELRYDGHGAEMGALFARLRALDPTRLVTTGGPFPQAEGAEVLDFHGWGSWSTRNDHWYYHPEERPSYLRSTGVYNHRPAGEPAAAWGSLLDASPPGYFTSASEPRFRGLLQQEGRPVLFSEGHYYEDGEVPELTGPDAWRPLPIPTDDWWSFPQAHHFLNWLACRRWSVQNVRIAGFPSAMIHVDRGVGRWIEPLAALAEDRDLRVRGGGRLQLRFQLINDLTTAVQAHARWRLYDGDQLLAEQAADPAIAAGARTRVPIDLPVAAAASDRTLRLHVELWADGRSGWFRDDHLVTAYAPISAAAPRAGLAVYDPAGAVLPHLARLGVRAQRLEALAAWQPEQPLLIAPEALAGADDAVLGGLRSAIAAGGRAVILAHHAMPAVLSRPLVQRSGPASTCTRVQPSGLVAGLLDEDLRHWRTTDNDQAVLWDAIDIPAGGNARAHLLSANGTSPLLELREGAGAVVLCQLNLAGALGREPAADCALADLIGWLAGAAPFRTVPTLLIASDPAFAAAMQGRIGLVAETAAAPSAEQVAAARLIVLRGDHASSRAALDRVRGALAQSLAGGASLVLLGVDRAAAAWVSGLAGVEVGVDERPVEGAFRTRYDGLLAGTSHRDLWWVPVVNRRADEVVPAGPATLAACRLTGVVAAVTTPAVIGTVPVGRGRIVLSTIRALAHPVPSATRLVAAMLSDAGARLEADGLAGGAWASRPVAVARPAPAAPPAALTHAPTGAQRLAGIDWLLPAQPALLAVADARTPLTVAVGRHAERLCFLHAAVGGRPVAVYKITYLEDRLAWIPGKPDPFTLVPVRLGNQIQAADEAARVARGEAFLGGAQLAWRDPAGGGLYRFDWDNPNPGKTIEQVELIVAADTGAVAWAGLATAERAGAAPPLDQLIGAGKEAQVFARISGANYGAVLMRDGTVPMIHDAQGRGLLGLRGWAIQDGRRQEGGQVDIVEEPSAVPGARTFVLRGGPGQALAWHGRLEFSPSTIRASWTYRWADPASQAPHSVVGILRYGDEPWGGHEPNQLPVLIPVATGLASVQFDRSFIGWYINHNVENGNVNLFLKPLADRDRAAWFEIRMP